MSLLAPTSLRKSRLGKAAVVASRAVAPTVGMAGSAFATAPAPLPANPWGASQ